MKGKRVSAANPGGVLTERRFSGGLSSRYFRTRLCSRYVRTRLLESRLIAPESRCVASQKVPRQKAPQRLVTAPVKVMLGLSSLAPREGAASDGHRARQLGLGVCRSQPALGFARFFRTLSLLCFFLCFFGAGVFTELSGVAQGRAPSGKSLTEAIRSIDSDATYQFKLSNAVDRLVSLSADTDIYDPLTIATLRRMREEAQPSYNPRDIDPEKLRRVTERAFAIQSGKVISNTLYHSELRPEYRAFQETVRSIQSFFRYSVQTNGEQLSVGKKSKGRKLIELNVELSLRTGLDPQVRLGRDFRFRYDRSAKAPMLEYGFNF